MRLFEYPGKPGPLHRSVVETLLRGGFVSFGQVEYDFLSEHRRWYEDFFHVSFGIDLLCEGEVFYCVNTSSSSRIAERLLTMVAVLLYEIGKDGRDPVAVLKNEIFTVDKINRIMDGSVQFPEYAKSHGMSNAFLGKLESLGIVRRAGSEENEFLFAPAIDVFLNKYKQINDEFSLEGHEEENQKPNGRADAAKG